MLSSRLWVIYVQVILVVGLLKCGESAPTEGNRQTAINPGTDKPKEKSPTIAAGTGTNPSADNARGKSDSIAKPSDETVNVANRPDVSGNSDEKQTVPSETPASPGRNSGSSPKAVSADQSDGTAKKGTGSGKDNSGTQTGSSSGTATNKVATPATLTSTDRPDEAGKPIIKGKADKDKSESGITTPGKPANDPFGEVDEANSVEKKVDSGENADSSKPSAVSVSSPSSAAAEANDALENDITESGKPPTAADILPGRRAASPSGVAKKKPDNADDDVDSGKGDTGTRTKSSPDRGDNYSTSTEKTVEAPNAANTPSRGNGPGKQAGLSQTPSEKKTRPNETGKRTDDSDQVRSTGPEAIVDETVSGNPDKARSRVEGDDKDENSNADVTDDELANWINGGSEDELSHSARDKPDEDSSLTAAKPSPSSATNKVKDFDEEQSGSADASTKRPTNDSSDRTSRNPRLAGDDELEENDSLPDSTTAKELEENDSLPDSTTAKEPEETVQTSTKPGTKQSTRNRNMIRQTGAPTGNRGKSRTAERNSKVDSSDRSTSTVYRKRRVSDYRNDTLYWIVVGGRRVVSTAVKEASAPIGAAKVSSPKSNRNGPIASPSVTSYRRHKRTANSDSLFSLFF